jgi:hypothetical protein
VAASFLEVGLGVDFMSVGSAVVLSCDFGAVTGAFVGASVDFGPATLGTGVAARLLPFVFVAAVGLAVAFSRVVGTGVVPAALRFPAFAEGTGETRLLPPFFFAGTGVTLAPRARGLSEEAGAEVAPFFVVSDGAGDTLPFLPPGIGVAATAPVFLLFCAAAGFTFGEGVATGPVLFSFAAASLTFLDMAGGSSPASLADLAASSAAREPGVTMSPVLKC